MATLLSANLHTFFVCIIALEIKGFNMLARDNEEENFRCFTKIMNVAVCEGLREIFKREWDKKYSATKGEWDDTCLSGDEFYKMEKTRHHAKLYLDVYKTGERSEWDISALSDAILYSNALNGYVPPHVSNKVDELRDLRNKLSHKFASKHRMPDAAFDNAFKKVKNCFNVLKLPTTDVERIKNSLRRDNTPCTKYMTYFVAVMIIFSIFIVFVAYWLSFPKLLETKSNFRVLPTKPVHLVANRSLTVDAILQELKILDTKNRRSLTHLYISGNPGSGKSQLARLIGERYGIDSPENGSWFSGGTSVFVMTLNGRSLDDLLSSYVDFARRLDCNENILASIRDSNKTTTREKIDSLKTEISKTLRKNEDADKFLIIVDNVVRLSEISSFLPEMGNEDWQGGQVLLTTQDMSSVPANSSMTVHISVSQGMNPAESCQFLTDLSGVSEIPDLVNKVAKELDYQPLALASAAFYVKILRETKASAQFSWNDYLKKLSDDKRNLTEMKLSEINKPAYSLTMSKAVLLAIRMFAEKEIVLKHAFTFFSYVSYKPLPLQAVVSFVLNIDNGNDEDDVSLRILQCSLVLHSDEKKNVSILVHRVVHDMIVLYNKPNIKVNGKLGKPLKIFQSLLQEKCALGEIALIPHLETLSAKTKGLSPKI